LCIALATGHGRDAHGIARIYSALRTVPLIISVQKNGTCFQAPSGKEFYVLFGGGRANTDDSRLVVS
jgi:hypothetical protein